MVDSIKDRVAIAGMGCTNFGEHWNKSATDLAVEAAYEAYEDAGIEPEIIQAAWVGAFYEYTGQAGMAAAIPLRLQYKPVTRVENMCCTGTDALRNASYSVASGVVDVALAIGVEKIKDQGISGLGYGAHAGANVTAQMSAPSVFALLATRYFARYGLTPEEGKRMIGMISVKSHRNGVLNPRAHLRREVTIEQVLSAPIISWPLGLFDCCGVSDGSAQP